MRIERIADARLKSLYAEKVLRQLPDWFGIEAALLEYVAGVAPLPYWAAMDGEECVGFIAVKIHYAHTGDIYHEVAMPPANRRRLMAAAAVFRNRVKYHVKT